MTRADTAGDAVRLDALDGGAMVAWIDRERSRNALSPEVLEGLTAAVSQANCGEHAVLVIRGRGGTLSAGADLFHLLSILDSPDQVRAYVAQIGELNTVIEQARAITVAVVDGYAVAGGLELMLACDLSVVTNRSQIGDRHLEFGLLPGAGGSVRLPQAIPKALARRLMLTGEMIDGATAYDWGLAAYAVAHQGLEDSLAELVARLVRHSPAALASMKRLYRDAGDRADQSRLQHELEVFMEYTKGPDIAAGLQSFGERRQVRPLDRARIDDPSNP